MSYFNNTFQCLPLNEQMSIGSMCEKSTADLPRNVEGLHDLFTDTSNKSGVTSGTIETLLSRSKSDSVKYPQSTVVVARKATPNGEENNIHEQFLALGDTFTSAKAKHVTWSTNVNLAPPHSWKGEPPPEDEHIWSYYNSLQYTLFETGYPETVDRTASPRSEHNPAQVAVAVLASPFECVGILLEGGRRLPDSFHLLLSPTWLTQVPSQTDPNITELYIHKAVTFGLNGVSYIDEFETPRRVTYFMNFFTEAITGGQRSDGTQFEENLGCPISSSVVLANLIGDRLWTRRKMAEAGMATPITLGLMFKPKWKPPLQEVHNIKCVDITDTNLLTVAEEDVAIFLAKLRANGVEKAVVKPSGPKFCGSIGVSFHSTNDVQGIQQSTLSLLEEIESGNSVLIESFEETFVPTKSNNTPLWNADDTFGFRVNITVCRDFTDSPITSKITSVSGPKDYPINGDDGVSQTLDSTLIAHGVDDACERRRVYDVICKQSEEVLQRIIDTEKLDITGVDLLPGAQTDIIGIDMVITKRDGMLTPVGIEVNSHGCTINCQISEFMSSLCRNLLPVQQHISDCTQHEHHPMKKIFDLNDSNVNDFDTKSSYMALENNGESLSVRPLVETMIHRSQLYLMEDKNVVVIGAGGYSKRKIWSDAAKYGIKVTLVESKKYHFAKDLVSRFIHYDFDDHKQDPVHAQKISTILRNYDVTADGCVTFWEYCVPLAAHLCELLGLNGSSVSAAWTAKKKSRTQLVVRANNEDIPHWPRPYFYSSNVHCLNSSQGTNNEKLRLNFPTILKLEYGSSAVGVTLVKNEDELRQKYTEISEKIRSESDYAGVVLGYDNSMFVSDYHVGSEHDVDLVMFGRRPLAAFISDNGPTRVPLFTGLSDGTFNVELKLTSTGPKLIEINARMGGFYLREWIHSLYGVDIMLSAFMIACGIQPYIPKRSPNHCFMGIMLLPSLHGHLFDDGELKKLLNDKHEKGDILWTQFVEFAKSKNDIHEAPIGNIAVKGRTSDEARQKLLHICKVFNIEASDYCVSDFVKHFR